MCYDGTQYIIQGDGASAGSGGTPATQPESETGTDNTAMTTPLAATYSVASAGACGLVRTSTAIITIFPGATTAHPCVVQVGNVSRRFTAPATVTLGGSSVSVNASVAYFYVKSNGTIYVGLSSAFAAGAVSESGASEETPITDFPAGAVKLGTWLAGTTDDNWDSTGGDGNGGNNYISLRTKSSLLAGTGVTVTENSDGEETIATDTTTIPTKEELATNSLIYSTITGTTTLTMTTTSPASPNANGVCVYGKMGASNSSGTVTLAVNGATARNVYKLNGSSDASQVGSELRANTIYQFCYDTSLGSQVWLVNPGGAGGGGSVATDTIFDAKGDLAIGTGADTAQKLTVGSNGMAPIAASGETTGVKWGYIVKEDTFPSALCGGSYASGWSFVNGAEPSGTGACGSGYTSGLPQQSFLSFADGANTYAAFNWKLPSTFVALVSVTYHFATDGTSGNVALRYGAMCFGSTDSWLAGTPSFTDDSIFTSAASAGTYAEKAEVHSTTNVDSCSATGARVAMKIGREGTDGGDTNANTLYLFGITIKYTARVE
jgi:hypothetical protein